MTQPYRIPINSQAKTARSALVTSIQQSLPDFILGDKRLVRISLHESDGSYSSISGSNDYSLSVAIGNAGAVPESGTYTLTYGANTTSAIAYNATAATVQTALNGLASIISAGGVVVTGTAQAFKVAFNSVGSRTAISGDGTSLSPVSGIVVLEAVTGDGSTKEVQLIRVRQSVVAYQDTWTQALDEGNNVIGWDGYIDTATIECALQLGDSESVSDLELEVETTDLTGAKTTWLQMPVTLRNDIIDITTLSTLALPEYLTKTEADALYLSITDATNDYVKRTDNEYSLVEITADTNLTRDTALYYYFSASSKTATLWATPLQGDFVVFVNYSGGNATVDGNGKDIRVSVSSADPSYTMADGQKLYIVYSGTEWIKL